MKFFSNFSYFFVSCNIASTNAQDLQSFICETIILFKAQPFLISMFLMAFGGKNLSPHLSWKNANSQAKSFALTVYLTRRPNWQSGWWHWVLLNIQPNMTHCQLILAKKINLI